MYYVVTNHVVFMEILHHIDDTGISKYQNQDMETTRPPAPGKLISLPLATPDSWKLAPT